ncbi:YHS domain-containing (seleno)protein [uncultured Roseovarius sp.]|uniref:YHS domain-containing (seleno)protein n=1 Tax=uncultured Roseovarius sp. TaxID=293344 RepID=UPI002612F0A3|nr:YHS domain-containing (seleno)protein [uncultured Roseovarius sp.]
MTKVLRHLTVLVHLLCIAFAGLAQAGPASEVNLGYFNKLAMNGYDVMTYWNGGDPQKGDPEIQASFKDATWVFISAENREAFLADPERFAPQYGGYCAFAASQNAVADVDPFAWRIWDDKLYLNYSPRVRRQWASDIDGNIEKADGYWPMLLSNQ